MPAKPTPVVLIAEDDCKTRALIEYTETGVQGTGIHVRREAQLPDTPQALEIRVINQIEQYAVWHRYKAINGVVEDFFPAVHRDV